jgi:hypothetical protein
MLERIWKEVAVAQHLYEETEETHETPQTGSNNKMGGRSLEIRTSDMFLT